MSDQDSKRQNAGHTEARPHTGFIGQAAQAVTSYCMLPDHRSKKRDDRWFWEKPAPTWLGGPNADKRQQNCIDSNIATKARENEVPMPAKDSEVYRHILRHVDDMTKSGIARCQTRDYPNSIDPRQHYGYRDANGQCAITTDKQLAQKARKEHPQTAR